MMETIVEVLFVIGALVNAGLFIPQAIKLYKNKSAEEVSLLTFLGFNLIQLVTMFHGYYNNDILLILGNIANFITCGIVTILVIIYKLRNDDQPIANISTK